LLGAGALTLAADVVALRGQWPRLLRSLGWNLAYPLALAGALAGLPLAELPLPVKAALTLAIVAPMGPMIYRLAFQPVAQASVLVLLFTTKDAVVPEGVADAVIRLDEYEDLLMPLQLIVPLQLFAYYMAVLRGCDVDKPRNLAKSVTVE
jgi:hypothetical protein